MAKRELSSTLRNLKFMQKAVHGEEQWKKEQESTPDGNSHPLLPTAIVEGDPHPGAIKGRMSFQSFNRYVDKLNEEVSPEASTTCSNNQTGRISDRENGSAQDGSESLKLNSFNNDSTYGEFKRKQREKLDWNVLRPPKGQMKRR